MPISHIHTYLVHPAKRVESPPDSPGATVPLTGKMYELLKGIYERSEQECDTAISFNCADDGRQNNPCRDLLIKYVGGPTAIRGQRLAERLAAQTTNRSRLGLLFLICGIEGVTHKVVLSRFPADSGISAEQNANGLNVEFLERIFMKSAKSYKSAVYKHDSLEAGFWKGHVVDKQLNESDVSDYWIIEFLASDLLTTAAAGTQRLARAFKEAAKGSNDIAIKSELAAAMQLAPGQKGRRITAREFTERVGLSDEAKHAVVTQMKASVVDERFQFDAAEFKSLVRFRSVALDNGGMLTAESEQFDKVFTKEAIGGHRIRFSTQGEIVDDKLTKGSR